GVGDESNGKTASWGDYDQDGLLDLYLANWSCTPKCGRSFEGDKDRLYHNDGDNTFTDVTIALGSKTRGAGFVASFVDFDNDADLDIYLVNDEFINPIGNVLWRNDGAGCDAWCFTDVAEEFGADTRVMGMGLATGDYDNDGDFDFYFSNAGPMTLLQNQGDGFENMAVDAGVEFSKSVGWGSVFFDYNNDGWSDLYLAVMDGVSGGTTINALFENNGDGTFTDLAEASGAGNSGHSIGVAYADYDMDGWVDLVVGNYDEGYTLYRNQGARLSSNNWLTFKLVGSGAVNRDAAGARVTVVDSNGRSQMQEVRIGSSLGSGDSLELHFGFGDAIPESVIIRWPDGSEQMIDAPELNQRIVVTYGVTVVAEPVETDATGFVVLLTAVLFSVIALMIVKEKKWK
ncbi:MAG: CRTAC1 family protein, partial [Chloroflexi bacterium]|nr:CRTAC1 family protein [Chloroflexota bacterium]